MTGNTAATRRYMDKQRSKGMVRLTLWVPEDDRQLALEWARKRRRRAICEELGIDPADADSGLHDD